MDATMMQSWLTLSGSSSATTIAQDPASYLDLPPAIDLVFHVQTSAVTVSGGLVRIEFQTAPLCNEEAFRTMTSFITLDPSIPLTTNKATLKLATVPVARFIRWRLSSTGSGAWSATFRVYASFSVSADPGNATPEPLASARQGRGVTFDPTLTRHPASGSYTRVNAGKRGN